MFMGTSGFIYIFGAILWSSVAQVNCQEPPNELPNFPPDIPLTTGTYVNWCKELLIKNLWIATPRQYQDVITLANWAYANGYTLRANGYMHNWSHLTVTRDTDNNKVVLIDTTENLTLMEFSSAYETINAVRVQTGTTMVNLLSFLEESGFGLYSVPAIGQITVGGALAIGGHGTGIPPLGEEENSEFSYGTLSNLILSFNAVVWDPSSEAYILKTFKRSDIDAEAFLVHLGRAFITEVTLMVGSNYNLRCQSRTDISGDELFADPELSTSKTRTFASFIDKHGRAEIILFPFTTNAWLKVWTETPVKPLFSRRVSKPFNYPFSDNVPESVADLYAKISNGAGYLNPLLNKAEYLAVTAGLVLTLSADIWGPSKNLLLYVKPTTLRMTANGYAIITARSNIQKVVSKIWPFYKGLVDYYHERGEYPLSGPLEIRITKLDQPGLIYDSRPPVFSAVLPVENHPEFDTAVWFDILSIPYAPYINEAMAVFESFLYNTFDGTDGIVRTEWSKGWAYASERGAWSNATVYRDIIPKSFPETADSNGWNWGVSTLDKYDPHRVFTNEFLDVFFAPTDN